MKIVKQTAEYAILQRRDGRHAVRGKGREWINGNDKVAILVKEGFLKQDAPKPKPKAEDQEPEAADNTAEETSGEPEAS